MRKLKCTCVERKRGWGEGGREKEEERGRKGGREIGKLTFYVDVQCPSKLEEFNCCARSSPKQKVSKYRFHVSS